MDGAVFDQMPRALASGQQAEADVLLAQAVGWGDAAVPGLIDLFKRQTNESARLYAAAGLAHIGSASGIQELLNAVSALPAGDLKEEIAQRIAGVTNRAAAGPLLVAVTTMDDEAVLKASLLALTQMADDNLVAEMISRYDHATQDKAKSRIADVIASIENPDATVALIELANRKDRPASDPLIQAAEDGLSWVGTAPAASFLLQRLATAPPEQKERIHAAVANIRRIDARAVFELAAMGSKKDPLPEQSRVVAIQALANYPDDATARLLEKLAAADQSKTVSAAAKTTLAQVKRALTP